VRLAEGAAGAAQAGAAVRLGSEVCQQLGCQGLVPEGQQALGQLVWVGAPLAAVGQLQGAGTQEGPVQEGGQG
jgi:hypothetical protein